MVLQRGPAFNCPACKDTDFGLSGFGGPLDFILNPVAGAVGEAQAGIARLKTTLMVITVLSGIAALTGIVAVLRRH